MERLLKPGKLEVLPDDPEAVKIFDYWLTTFNTFLANLEERTAEGERDRLDRLGLLTTFLTHRTYELIADATSYAEAQRSLQNAYHKQKNVIFARHLLMSRSQKAGESISSYVHSLKQLARDCNFQAVTAETYRDDMTRDAFINGLSSSEIRRRLLEDNELSLQAAVNKADMLDRAERQSNYYSENYPISKTVAASFSKKPMNNNNTRNITRNSAKERKCFFCGGNLHPNGRIQCPAKNKTCSRCRKVGHFSRVCQSSNSRSTAAALEEDQADETDDQTDDTSTCISLLASAPACLNQTVINVIVDKLPLQALIDTGASNSFINEAVAKNAKLKIFGKPSRVAMASEVASAPILGKTSVNLSVKGQSYADVALGVVPGLCADVVLGQDFIRQHDEVIIKLGGPRKTLLIDKDPICSVSACDVRCDRLFKTLKSECKPIATRSRKFNHDDKLFIKNEVKSLLQKGIIEPSYSPWRAQVLVVREANRKPRMVIDYSQTINRYTMLDAYPLPNIDEQIGEIAKSSVFSTLDLKSAYYQIPLHHADRPYTAFEADGKLYHYTRLPFGVTNGVSYFQRFIDSLIERFSLKRTYAYVDNITVCGTSISDHDANLKALLEAAKKEGLTFNPEKCLYNRSEICLLGYKVSHLQIQPDPERLRPLLKMSLPKSKPGLQRVLGMFSYYAKWVPDFSSKIRPLVKSNTTSSFPLSDEASESFNTIRRDLANACVTCIRDNVPFVLECDASDSALAATLNQGGQPVAFHSRTFSKPESRYSTVEKEATAIMDAVRKWCHLLYGKHFTLITDQRAVSFMFDSRRMGKIKNTKIQTWRAELGNFDYSIKHRPGSQNVAPDALSRLCMISRMGMDLVKIHEQLGHPGISRLSHFIRMKNLPYSMEEIKKVCLTCRVCAELKPRYYNKPQETLIKSSRAWERISVDFKGPLEGRNTYVLFVVDEFSRYPFAFPCKNMSSSTVIQCLSQLFCLFGFPSCVHSDRGSAFISREVKEYLNIRGVSTTTSTPYHPTGNAQCERINQTVWRTLQLILKSHRQPTSSWETLLPEALHAVRSLLCTATNCTPHERFLGFPRRSMIGKSLPSWLIQPGPILLRRFVRNKNEPLVDEVDLIEANPSFAKIRYPNGRESTVSVNDLAPCPPSPVENVIENQQVTQNSSSQLQEESNENSIEQNTAESSTQEQEVPETSTPSSSTFSFSDANPALRRSTRERRPPQRYGHNIYEK